MRTPALRSTGSGRGIGSWLSNRICRHEICPFLSGQLHQSGFIGAAGGGALFGRLGLSDPGRNAGELAWPIGRQPRFAGVYRCPWHRDDSAQGLLAGVYCDLAALDGATGAD